MLLVEVVRGGNHHGIERLFQQRRMVIGHEDIRPVGVPEQVQGGIVGIGRRHQLRPLLRLVRVERNTPAPAHAHLPYT